MAATTTTTMQRNGVAHARTQHAAVRRYLEALERGPRRGRRTDPEVLRARLAEVEERLAEVGVGTERLELIQRRIDLREMLDDTGDDSEELEAEFLRHAAAYSDRKGITWAAWREIGVPAATLRAAGIDNRTTNSNGDG